jgi:hypothetical protein
LRASAQVLLAKKRRTTSRDGRPSTLLRGYDELKSLYSAISEIGTTRLIWTMHYMISPRIRINADRTAAQVSWRVWELATVPGKPPQPEAVWGGGSYQVDLARIAGKWQFTHVRLKLGLISQYTEGWAATRLAQL